MNRIDAEKRDLVLRAFFEGKDWDTNDEFLLKRHVVLNSTQLLPDHPLLIDDEWDVVPGRSHEGRGDLVFTDGEGHFAVVEVKYLNPKPGKTARTKRNKSRSLVVEQAARYAEEIERREGAYGEVIACTYTNEAPNQVVRV